MRTIVWFIAPLVLGLLLGCVEKQGFPRIGKGSSQASAPASTQGNHSAFARSVSQEIAALDDFFSTLKNSGYASGKSLSKKDHGILNSAKAIAQEGKVLQKNGKSYRALQKIRTAKGLMNPMMKKLWKLGDKRAILGFVNQQIDIVQQRHHELEDLMRPGKTNSKKVVNAHQRSKALFDEAKKLQKNGKLRRAYVQSEDALESLDKAIAVVWRDRNS